MRPLLLACIVVFVSLCGCGRAAKQRAELRRTGAEHFNAADEAFKKGDYATALEQANAALEGGGINSDMRVEAMIMRAVSNAAEGNYDEALKEIEALKNSPASPARVLSALSFVLEQQGKTKEAKNVWNRARRIDRQVERFGG